MMSAFFLSCLGLISRDILLPVSVFLLVSGVCLFCDFTAFDLVAVGVAIVVDDIVRVCC